MILIRIVVCIVLFCLPVVALIALDGRPEAMIYLMFPMFGAIPAILGALLVFVPIEWLLDRYGLGRLKNIAVPIAGALLIFLFALIMVAPSGKLGLLVNRLAGGGMVELAPFMLWSVLGAFWGGLWRLTAWIGTKLRRRFGRQGA